MTNRYSLADYTLKITLPAKIGANTQLAGKTITIGGPGETGIEGSFVGSVKVSRKNDTWSTKGDPTGSWVHSKSLDRTGSVEIELNQVADAVVLLSMVFRSYEFDDSTTTGMTIGVYKDSELIQEAEDCYIVKPADFELGEEARTQTWEFTAGRVSDRRITAWPTEKSL